MLPRRQSATTAMADRGPARPAPDFLPSANSRKWHNRRRLDGLGYLRARLLSNPTWPRDTAWLAHFLVVDRDRAPAEDQPVYQAAIAAVRRYPRTALGTHDANEAWDEVLAAIDEVLVLVQRRHRE